MARKGGTPENLIPAKKGEVRNPYGARRTIGKVNAELETEGHSEASPNEIRSCYLRLINLTIPVLTKMVSDESQPALIRVVGKAILSGKGFEIIDKILDRSIGKAQQYIEHSGEITIQVDFSND